MMTKQKCFSCIATVLLVVVLLLLVLAGIYFVSTQEVKAPTINNGQTY